MICKIIRFLKMSYIMKLSKIQRPEVEVEYVGVIGFIQALFAILRIGIKKAKVNILIRSYCNGNAGIVKIHNFYIIPKYKFKKVAEITEESESKT